MRTMTRRAMRGVGLLCAAALSLTACGSSDDDTASDKSVSGGDLRSALKEGGSITVWAWEPTLKTVVKDFEKKYPKVKVKLVNAGTNDAQYTALQNALQAGSGVPDVAQIEYYAVGQFALGKSLEDLSGYGAAEYKDDYSPGPWNAVTEEDAVYALPMDSGPMALFYNKKVLDKYQIAIPTTWDEYLEAARALHAADPKAYITNDTGDPGFMTSLIWQAAWDPVQEPRHRCDGRPHRRQGCRHLHQGLAEAPRREAPGAHRELERRVVQGAGRRHHRHPRHRRVDARQLRVGRGVGLG